MNYPNNTPSTLITYTFVKHSTCHDILQIYTIVIIVDLTIIRTNENWTYRYLFVELETTSVLNWKNDLVHPFTSPVIRHKSSGSPTDTIGESKLRMENKPLLFPVILKLIIRLLHLFRTKELIEKVQSRNYISERPRRQRSNGATIHGKIKTRRFPNPIKRYVKPNAICELVNDLILCESVHLKLLRSLFNTYVNH